MATDANTPTSAVQAFNLECLRLIQAALAQGDDVNQLVGPRGLDKDLRDSLIKASEKDLRAAAERFPVAILKPTASSLELFIGETA